MVGLTGDVAIIPSKRLQVVKDLKMKKIAIVGVEGSGKTVLMAAMGDKYENPDGFGLFLSPENSDAFGYVKLQMDRMRHGIWPSATIAGKSNILEWGLFRKSNGHNSRLCDLSFLDFSGEVYRMAFGSKSDHDAAQYDDVEIEESINELRQHIKASDTLIVLINLKDIISGSVGNPRTREAMWLSKSILDYAMRELHIPHVAMVFTQTDAYRATIAECGGVRGAYEKYLPHVSNIYPDMRLLAVSAVNMTFPDENGIPCPVDGFRSEGLEDLMEWIVSTVPGSETLISDIKNAPSRCRDKVWILRDEYIAALSGGANRRGEILDQIEVSLSEMESAMRIYPQALPHAALDFLREELQDIRNFEIAYDQLCDDVPSMTDEQISQGVDELCRGSSFAGKVRQKVEAALFAVRDASHAEEAKKRRKKRWAVVISIFVLGAIAISVWLVHAREERALVAEEEASKSKIARGWSHEWRKGHKIAVWKPGAYHSRTTNLKADYTEEKWLSTKPGYVWTGGTKIEWRKGQTSSQYPHWMTTDKEGYWTHEDGYKAAHPNGTGIEGKGAIWNPSWVSKDGDKRATSKEGVFEFKADCSSCSGTGRRREKRKCRNCNGSRKVSSSYTCPDCSGLGQKRENCYLCDGSGSIKRTCPDCRSLYDRFGNYIAHGQVCDNCGGSGCVVYNGGGSFSDELFAIGMLSQGRVPLTTCSKCNGYGAYHHSTCGQSGVLMETCSRCNGTGSTSKKCVWCSGTGTASRTEDCDRCDQNGYVNEFEHCSNCNGTGKVWRKGWQ